ncbi:hypothetical protein [Parvibium lacunae]
MAVRCGKCGRRWPLHYDRTRLARLHSLIAQPANLAP